MNALLKTALGQREELQFEREELLEAVKDKNFPQDLKEDAELKLLMNQQNINLVDGIIERQLEQTPISEVLNDIDNNLSTKCN